MPRSERGKRDADRKNKETTNATGQTKIASFFKSQETGQTSTHNDGTAEMEVAPIVNAAHESGPEKTTVIVDQWIKVVSEFNAGEKLRSERNGSKNTKAFLSP